MDIKKFITHGPYDNMAKSHPSLRRRLVWCLKCGKSQRINPAECLSTGWPKCCNETMTIDNPEERGSFEWTHHDMA